MTPPTRGEECRALFARVSEYLDGDLNAAPCAALEGHMEDCPACREFVDSLRRTVEHLRAAPEGTLPPELREEVVRAWRHARGET